MNLPKTTVAKRHLQRRSACRRRRRSTHGTAGSRRISTLLSRTLVVEAVRDALSSPTTPRLGNSLRGPLSSSPPPGRVPVELRIPADRAGTSASSRGPAGSGGASCVNQVTPSHPTSACGGGNEIACLPQRTASGTGANGAKTSDPQSSTGHAGEDHPGRRRLWQPGLERHNGDTSGPQPQPAARRSRSRRERRHRARVQSRIAVKNAGRRRQPRQLQRTGAGSGGAIRQRGSCGNPQRAQRQTAAATAADGSQGSRANDQPALGATQYGTSSSALPSGIS